MGSTLIIPLATEAGPQICPKRLSKTDRLQPGSAKTHRGLPHEGQQQEKEWNDRQDIHQRPKGLIGLGQLGQRRVVGSETGQQEVRHGEIGDLWSGPMR